MGPRQVDEITHKELSILMRAATERAYDEYENMSFGALMNRQAYHAKKLKQSDLFKRPVDVVEAKNRQKEMQEKQRHAEQWLAQYEIIEKENEE